MSKAVVMSLVVVLASALSVFAQNVPDLSNKNWNLVGEFPVNLRVDANGTKAIFATKAKVYENSTDNMEAEVLMWQGEEVAMVYGPPDAFAIRVDGKWYVAKSKDTELKAVAVYTNNEPSAVKLSLETTDGLKEVLLQLN